MILPKPLVVVCCIAMMALAALAANVEAQAGRRGQPDRRPSGRDERAERPARQASPRNGNEGGPQLRIEPDKTVLRPGEKATFDATPYGANGEELRSQIEWSALFGGINEKGEYTASRREGGCLVKATDRKHGLEAKATVIVTTADAEEMGEIDVLGWNVDKRSSVMASPNIAIRFVGSDQARTARIFLHRPGQVNQHQTVQLREDRSVQFQQNFNPSGVEYLEVVVYDHRNRALGAVVRHIEERDEDKAPDAPLADDETQAGRRGQEARPPAAREEQPRAREGDEDEPRLSIDPEKAVIRPGEKATFQATPYDANGEELDSEIEWSAIFGKINEKGEYTASRREGACLVKATDRKNGLEGKAPVTVTTADPEAMGEIEILHWSVDKRTSFMARPNISIRFVGSDQARTARIFLHRPGQVNQLQFAQCREGRTVQFRQIFNPSAIEYIEVVVYDFRNRALGAVVRHIDEEWEEEENNER